MNEREWAVLGQYEVTVQTINRVRGAFLCEGEDGLWLLKERTASSGRLHWERQCLLQLEQQGVLADIPLPNSQGELLTTGEDGRTYYLRRWFPGRECDLSRREDVWGLLEALGRLHQALRRIPRMPYIPQGDEGEQVSEGHLEEAAQGEGQMLGDGPYVAGEVSICQDMARHNRELKRAGSFIRRKKRRTDLERMLLQGIGTYLPQAEETLAAMEALEPLPSYLCQGDYTHHTVLAHQGSYRVVEFSRMRYGSQLDDLYRFLRKCMEKYQWDIALGRALLDRYAQMVPVTGPEKEYLRLRLRYPEKFWKQVNFYFNRNKAWIPGKNMEKLQVLDSQRPLREAFWKQVW